MSMPIGHKTLGGYATIADIEGAADYRKIAEVMTLSGVKMNHSTARNIFLSAMRKIAKPVSAFNSAKTDELSIDATSRDPRFQIGVAEILFEMKSKKHA